MTQQEPRTAAPREEQRYIHALRLLACFLVVVNHTHSPLLGSGAPGAVLFGCLCLSLSKMAVTLFVMISGILLLGRDYGAGKIARCIARALLLLLGVSALLAVWQEGFAGLLPGRFLPALLAGPRMPPYWYLYALPAFYLALPFLQKMARQFTPRDYWLFTALLLLLPGALTLARVYAGLPVAPAFSLALLPKFLTVAVAGKAVSLLPRRRGGMLLALGLFLLAWGGLFASFYLPWRAEGRVGLALDSWDLLPAVVMAGSCAYLFRCLSVGERLRPRGAAVLRECAGLALGIYVLHPVLIHFVSERGFLRALSARSPVLGAPANALCLFALCGLIVFLLRRVPLVRRLL